MWVSCLTFRQAQQSNQEFADYTEEQLIKGRIVVLCSVILLDLKSVQKNTFAASQVKLPRNSLYLISATHC